LTTVGITFARSAVFDGPWNAVVNMLDGMRSNEDEIESDDEQERLESVHDEKRKKKIQTRHDRTRNTSQSYLLYIPDQGSRICWQQWLVMTGQDTPFLRVFVWMLPI